MILNKWLLVCFALLGMGLVLAGLAVLFFEGPLRAAAATVAVVDFALATFMAAKGIAEERKRS